MAISKAKKESIVAGLVEELRAATAIYVLDYKGLSEADDNMLRKQMHGKSVSYRVVKNTLVKKALEAAGVSGLDGVLSGVTALAFGSADEPMAPAKIFKEFIKGQLEKAESAEHNRLTGAGLACYDRHTLVKRDLRTLNQRVVANDKFAQHIPTS